MDAIKQPDWETCAPTREYVEEIRRRLVASRVSAVAQETGIRRWVAEWRVAWWADRHCREVARKRSDYPTVGDPESLHLVGLVAG